MYVKLFTQILDSSIADNRKLRHFFTDLLLCCDSKGFVVMTEAAIARRIGASLDEVKWGIDELQKPDPQSKTTDAGGARIERLTGIGYGWRVINFEHYRAMKDADQLREATRERVRRHREKKAGNASVTQRNTGNANTEAEAEAEAGTVPPKSPGSAPPRGQAGGITEGKDSQNIPTTEQSKRIARIFHRRLTTPWTPKEIRAYRALGTIPEEDLAAVEKYYAANWPPDRNTNILRHDLLTFLNNFQGEVDRSKRTTASKSHVNQRISTAQPHSRATGAENFAGRYSAPPPVWQEPPVDGQSGADSKPTPSIPGLSSGTSGDSD